MTLDPIRALKSLLRRFIMTPHLGKTCTIGSLFLKIDNYIAGINKLLENAEEFDELQFIDFGGGIRIFLFQNSTPCCGFIILQPGLLSIVRFLLVQFT